jgi:hypothetical protein
MGSLRTKPKLSESTICAHYKGGMSRFDICLRADIYDAELVATLRANGVPLRTDTEWRRIAVEGRERYKSNLRMRERQRKAG